MEQTLIIFKPDTLQRNLLGEIISRFERKGLKIIGLKMITPDDILLENHYAEHKNKPFFESLKRYLKSSPCLVMVLEGANAIKATRLLVGPTKGSEADAGSIRGDLAMSPQSNLVHASASKKEAEKEIKLFFKKDELFKYKKIDFRLVYSDEDLS